MAKIEVFRARNTTGLEINGRRVTSVKPYGLIQTIQKFNADDSEILEAIETDVQPVKRGAWKYYKNTGIFDIHKCSVCYTPFELPMDVVPSSVFCFCPHCGARMDGDTE